MNSVEDNEWSRGFSALASLLPSPVAILAVSAHWYVRGTFTTGGEAPQTIHDFGGFPAALYEVQYPAPGSPSLARRASALLGKRASVSLEWGLDHGTWSVLRHLRPAADVPVVQLSLDVRLALEEHVALGRALAPLREEGVLVMGSGNITHNLNDAFSRLDRGDLATPGWATRFDRDVAVALESHDVEFLAQAPETEAGASRIRRSTITCRFSTPRGPPMRATPYAFRSRASTSGRSRCGRCCSDDGPFSDRPVSAGVRGTGHLAP